MIEEVRLYKRCSQKIFVFWNAIDSRWYLNHFFYDSAIGVDWGEKVEYDPVNNYQDYRWVPLDIGWHIPRSLILAQDTCLIEMDKEDSFEVWISFINKINSIIEFRFGIYKLIEGLDYYEYSIYWWERFNIQELIQYEIIYSLPIDHRTICDRIYKFQLISSIYNYLLKYYLSASLFAMNFISSFFKAPKAA